MPFFQEIWQPHPQLRYIALEWPLTASYNKHDTQVYLYALLHVLSRTATLSSAHALEAHPAIMHLCDAENKSQALGPN